MDQSANLPERVSRDIFAARAHMEATRKSLTADELASMKDRRIHTEKTYPKYGAYLFSLDGYLNGEFLRGCLFAGQCMLVFGRTYKEALKLAGEGVESTVDLLFQHYEVQSALSHTAIELPPHPGAPLNPRQAKIIQLAMKDSLKK